MKTEHIITLYEKYLLQLQAKKQKLQAIKKNEQTFFNTYCSLLRKTKKRKTHIHTFKVIEKIIITHTPARNTKEKKKHCKKKDFHCHDVILADVVKTRPRFIYYYLRDMLMIMWRPLSLFYATSTTIIITTLYSKLLFQQLVLSPPEIYLVLYTSEQPSHVENFSRLFIGFFFLEMTPSSLS